MQIRPSNKQQGFTLIEVFLVVVVIAIILGIGVPSMARFFEEKRLIATTEQIYGHFQVARSEAIARSQNIYVNFDTNPSITGLDWIYGISTNASCTLATAIASKTNDNNVCVLVIDDGDGNLHEIDGVDGGAAVDDIADLVFHRFTSQDHSDVKMVLEDFSSGSQISFDGLRATAIGTAGNILLKTPANDLQLKIQVGALGQISICTPNKSVKSYRSCS